MLFFKRDRSPGFGMRHLNFTDNLYWAGFWLGRILQFAAGFAIGSLVRALVLAIFF